MKLNCSIKILNRLLPSLSMNSSTKYKYAVIYIKKQNKDFFVVVVTQNNKAGCRYKVNGNIEKTFGQFSEEGKCTIRFKEPCHDLLITAETASLKNFMLYIKKAWKGEINETDPVCKAVTNNIQCPSKLYKLKIEKREDYPTLKGFPKTLQFLSIENCKLIKFDSRLLELKSLTTLSLSKNKLTSIPENLGTLRLKKLTLDSNDLKDEDWKFLSGHISNTLEVLDISNNQVIYIPPILCRFHSLTVLRASRNSIHSIPFRICQLPKLQELDFSYNMLTSLPGTAYGRNFNLVDVSGNEEFANKDDVPVVFVRWKCMRRKYDTVVPSLLELAGMVIVDSRLPYNEQILPRILVRLLDNATQCFCGRMTIKTYGWEQYVTARWNVANTFTSTNPNDYVPINFAVCSTHSKPV